MVLISKAAKMCILQYKQMNKHPHTLRLTLFGIFVLVALLILIDFILPGRVINEVIRELSRERQQYYNAAQNAHYSYKVTTREHQFWVEGDFAAGVQDHEKIQYAVSRIFKEVNWYRVASSEKRATYSLRILPGLVLPLLAIISIIIAYSVKKNIDTLLFVLQALLIADLVYVLT